MKPRVFVSSTFYDLKYIREDLSNFIREHSFEPIKFEDGDIGYEPGKKIEESCYKAMENADIAVLIIGGKYGSAAAGEIADNKKFSDFISITRREFETAINNGVPVYAFIDASVYSEYNMYKNNIDKIEKNPGYINFPTVDNINVFRFIHEIYKLGTVSVTSFSNPKDIKEYLGKQWADMFKNYLVSLKDKEQLNKLQKSLSEMDELMKKMEIMINGISEKIFENDQEKYDHLIEKQTSLKIDKVCKFILENYKIEVHDENRSIENNVDNMLTCLLYTYLEYFKVKEEYDTLLEDDKSHFLHNEVWFPLDEKASSYALTFKEAQIENTNVEANEIYDVISKHTQRVKEKLKNMAFYNNIFTIVSSNEKSEEVKTSH